MKLKEAKTYALDKLKLERNFVRTFGKLTATQTWLDAIAAVEETSDDDILDLLGSDELPVVAVEATDELPVVAVEATEVAEPHVEAAASASTEEATEPNDTLLAFWESEPEQAPQPLAVLPPLDKAWDDPEPRSPGAAAVVVYPLVIALMMLWATVQVLLLGGKALCWVLSQAAEQLDVMAQKYLQQHRESALATTGAELTFAIP